MAYVADRSCMVVARSRHGWHVVVECQATQSTFLLSDVGRSTTTAVGRWSSPTALQLQCITCRSCSCRQHITNSVTGGSSGVGTMGTVQHLYPLYPQVKDAACQNIEQTTLTTRLHKVRTHLYVPTHLGVSRPPVLDCGTTFHLDYSSRDLPSTPSDNLRNLIYFPTEALSDSI